MANLGYVAPTIYTHPAYTARSINTSGALVLDIFTSDTTGHVTNITTRTLTLADLGYVAPTINNGTLTLNTSGTGISGSATFTANQAGASTFTVQNTLPDQIVSLTGAGATTITGTYPNFTISSTDNHTTYTAGTGLTLTGTAFSLTTPITNNNQLTNGAGYITSYTDTNTTYTAGTGMSLSGTVFNCTVVNTDSGFGNLQQTTDLGNTTQGSAHFGTTSALTNAGLSVQSGWASFTSNVGGISPPSSPGVHIGWNHSSGSQENKIFFGGNATTHQDLYIISRGYQYATKVVMAFKNTNIYAGDAGTGYLSITAANFITTSDRRLKSDIKPIKDGLSVLKQFTSYEYIKDDKQDAGFIAQEVQEVIPYSVMEDSEGYLTMNDRPILAHMHKAILELEARLIAIEEKLK